MITHKDQFVNFLIVVIHFCEKSHCVSCSVVTFLIILQKYFHKLMHKSTSAINSFPILSFYFVKKHLKFLHPTSVHLFSYDFFLFFQNRKFSLSEV